MNHSERYQKAKKITLIGATMNALLGFIKLVGGILFHSHALIADGIHSFSDLIADALVLLASKYGSQDADDLHPYGHQRIETAATLMLSLILIFAGIGIAWHSLDEIINKIEDIPGILALPIAAFSIVVNELLFHYTRFIGNQIHSALITANAWHHRSDAASSAVVLLGLIGSMAGFTFLDLIAAIVIGCMIIKMGFKYGWDSVRELIDTGIDSKKVAKIEHIIHQVDGVQKIHQLRNRKMGETILIDVHILVSPQISVSEGHHIAQQVHYSLMKQVNQIKDVTVHVDPEDDELISPSEQLPNRDIIEKSLLNPWRLEFPDIQSWVLHYLNGMITIDLIISEHLDQWHSLQKRIQDDLSTQPNIVSVRLLINKETLMKHSHTPL